MDDEPHTNTGDNTNSRYNTAGIPRKKNYTDDVNPNKCTWNMDNTITQDITPERSIPMM